MSKSNNLVNFAPADEVANKLSCSKYMLKIGHQNIQSLSSSIDEFKLLITHPQFDIVGVTETWMNVSTPKIMYDIMDYKIIRNDRAKGTRGGVAIYHKKSIKSKIVGKSCGLSRIEYLYVEFIFNSQKLVVCVYYIPDTPAIGEILEFEQLFSELVIRFNNFLIMGDFNVNILSNSSTSYKFKSMLQSNGLTYLNLNATRKISNTLLDLFITKEAFLDRIVNVNQITHGLSDHDLIFLNLKIRKIKFDPKYKIVNDINNINLQLLHEDVNKIMWDQLYYITDIDNKICVFYENIRFLLNKHIKKKKVLIKNKLNDWITDEILHLINKREKAYKIWLRTKTDEDKTAYRTYVNMVNRLKRKAKMSFFKVKLDTNLPSKKLYQNIRNIGLLESPNSNLEFNANEFNKYFTDTEISNAAIVRPDKNFIYDQYSGFSFTPVTETDILTYFSEIKTDAMGFDNIPTKFFRILLPYILPYITHIVNYCIISAYFPTIWKTAIITPVPKVQNPVALHEYRPISILCALSKVFEKALSSQIHDYLNVNKSLLDQFQSGYKRYHSTVTALLKVHSDIVESVNNSKKVLLILLDFSKAFDRIGHQSLISKLKYYFKFSGPALNLILSYLTKRYNLTKVGDVMSHKTEMINGVPQGSVLGPLLFVLYVVDLPGCLKLCNHHAYADDLQLYIDFDSNAKEIIQSQVNTDLKMISYWSKTNDILLNASKTQALIFKRSRDSNMNLDLTINNISLEFSESVKNLGVIMHENVGWSSNVANICRKVYIVLHRLLIVKQYTPISTRYLLVKSLLVPLFMYGHYLFFNMDSDSKRRLNVCFNNCARYIYSIKRREHISKYSSSILGCSLFDFYRYNSLCFYQQIIYSAVPPYLKTKLSFCKSQRTTNIMLPKINCKSFDDSFFVSIAKLWNNLPHELKRPCQPTAFRKKIKELFKVNDPHLIKF